MEVECFEKYLLVPMSTNKLEYLAVAVGLHLFYLSTWLYCNYHFWNAIWVIASVSIPQAFHIEGSGTRVHSSAWGKYSMNTL